MLVSKDYAWVFSGCKNREALVSVSMEEAIAKLVADAGFTVFERGFHKFPPHNGNESGYTAFIIIGESRVDIHSWPEADCAHIGICYCDFSQDNSEKKDVLIASLIRLFAPNEVTEKPMRELPIR